MHYLRRYGPIALSTAIILALLSPLQSGAELPLVIESQHAVPSVSPYAHELRGAIVRYEGLQAKGGWPVFTPGAKITPGQQDARLPGLKEQLQLMGDAPEPLTADAVYDDTTVQAVKHFQARHGLEADGTLGARTQAELSRSVEYRLKQMQATLERMEQDAIGLEPKYVLVNVPGYTLSAMENGREAFTSRVIVGDVKNETPLYQSVINAISFNPAWHVPSRIAAEEIAVKERDNPGYIKRAGFSLTDKHGQTVDPEEVDWYNTGKRLPYSLKQAPGAGNALGKIKFSIPNDHSVYLHSTSKPQLFNKTDRALSHGCIRVEESRKLAHFVMDRMDGWDETRVNKTYDSSTSRIVPITAPVPVHLVYWTAWVDGQGSLRFAPDIYKKDKMKQD